jgi:hypothetical protein
MARSSSSSHLYELAVPRTTIPESKARSRSFLAGPDLAANAYENATSYDAQPSVNLWVHQAGVIIELDDPSISSRRIRETHGDDAHPTRLVHEDSQLAAFLRSLAPDQVHQAPIGSTRVVPSQAAQS